MISRVTATFAAPIAFRSGMVKHSRLIGAELQDSLLVIREIIVDGRRTSIAPLAVRLNDIVSVEKIETNLLATLAVCGVVGAIVVVSVVFFRELSDELEHE